MLGYSVGRSKKNCIVRRSLNCCSIASYCCSIATYYCSIATYYCSIATYYCSIATYYCFLATYCCSVEMYCCTPEDFARTRSTELFNLIISNFKVTETTYTSVEEQVGGKNFAGRYNRIYRQMNEKIDKNVQKEKNRWYYYRLNMLVMVPNVILPSSLTYSGDYNNKLSSESHFESNFMHSIIHAIFKPSTSVPDR